MSQVKIAAVYMRGGTSKGVFLRDDSLPKDQRVRDRVLLRMLGSPDVYGQQIDGMGGATSSTSKVIVVERSSDADCDVVYRFGQVAVDKAAIDWSGNCGNLSSAVGPFAIEQGLVPVPADGIALVRLRHLGSRGTSARIDAHIPMAGGSVVEDGDFELDGVTFPAAEIRVEFLAAGGDGVFPTGNAMDVIEVPGLGAVEATLLNAWNPAVFVDASRIGMRGDEMQKDVNADRAVLARLETIRAHAAVRMGLAETVEEATATRLHTPKLCFVAPPVGYTASSGKVMEPSMMDLSARIVSMGKLHHAMTGTGAIAIGVAAAIPGTVIHRLLGTAVGRVRFGHPSGVMVVGAAVERRGDAWVVAKAVMSRTARRLMEGWVLVPERVFGED